MKEKYFHNEVVVGHGENLNHFCRVEVGKAIVVDPADSKIIKILQSGDTHGISNSIVQSPTQHVTLSQGESVISKIDLLDFIEAVSNAKPLARTLLLELLSESSLD
jgi:hypothetical protein